VHLGREAEHARRSRRLSPHALETPAQLFVAARDHHELSAARRRRQALHERLDRPDAEASAEHQ
jgi:hypothetical protein